MDKPVKPRKRRRTPAVAAGRPADVPAGANRQGGPDADGGPGRGRRRRKRLGQRLLDSAPLQRSIASVVTGYLKLVNATSSFRFDPVDPYARYVHLAPVIFTMWHGQHFMMPFARIFDFDVRVLISRHRDGEINALVAEKLGIRTIRGSTARDPSRMIEKGGMVGFLEMKAALEEGACVSMTADISNLAARRAGMGIVSLAKASGRAIIPVAVTTSRRIDVESWDKATVNLPFSRGVCAVAEPVIVPPDADPAAMEVLRKLVEDRLNEATGRARRLADRRNE